MTTKKRDERDENEEQGLKLNEGERYTAADTRRQRPLGSWAKGFFTVTSP